MGDETGTGQGDKLVDPEGKITFSDEQQVIFSREIGEMRKANRRLVQEEFEAKAAKATSDAAAAELRVKEKWQGLAEMHEKRVLELEPFEAEAKAARELFSDMLKARIKTLGDKAKKALGRLPGAESLSDLDKLDWLNQNEELFTGEPGSKTTGLGTPRKTGRVGTARTATEPSPANRSLRL